MLSGKKIFYNISAIITSLIMTFSVSACTILQPSTGNSGISSQEKPNDAAKLATPQVVLTDNIATWNADQSADRFEISLDGALSSIENTITSRALEDGQTFKIRAIGDGINYITSNWSNSVTYIASTNTYTITWKNGDTILETDIGVGEGVIPVYDGAAPTKAADAQYSYAFTGWTPEVVAANDNATYTAVFTSVINKYTVTWKNGDTVLETDENVEYGTMPTYDGETPTKEGNSQVAYVFSGWNPTVAAVTGNVTYYAQFIDTLPNKYIVTFLDSDGVTILSEQEVLHGTAATEPEVPEKDGYRFDGWDVAFDNITKDTVVTAKYQEEVEVQFLDYDGSTIYAEFIDKGGNLTNIPDDPVREYYAFTGWSTTVFENITEDLKIYAQYIRTYRVIFVDYDGTELQSADIKFGDAASAPADPTREGYTFTGWDVTFDNITEDLTVTATYQINKYTVTFIDGDGDVLLVVENIKHGFSVKAPEVEDVYFDWNAKKGYRFTGWSEDMDNITADSTIHALYEEEIKEPIIVVQSATVTSGTTSVPLRIYICSSEKFYGISLDITFDNVLQLGGAASADVHSTFGTMNTDYTSNLTDEGSYELRWTDGDGVDPSKFSGPIPLLTFTFNLYEYQKVGEYLVNILKDSYIINEDLVKIKPVVISGVVTIEEKE